jgi:hypothetical protein
MLSLVFALLFSVLYFFAETALSTVHEVLSCGRSSVIVIALGLSSVDSLFYPRKEFDERLVSVWEMGLCLGPIPQSRSSASAV